MRQVSCVILLGAVLAGCGPTVIIHEEEFRQAAPQTVAILPFRMDDDDPGERARLKVAAIREAFARRFSALPYLHLEGHVTDRLLRRAGLGDPESLSQTSHVEIREALGVDAFIEGEVTSLANLQAGLVFHQQIAGTIRMIDAETGEELIRMEHKERDFGGLLLGSGQSLEAIQQTIDNSNDIGFIRLAEEFVDSLIEKFPAPPVLPDVTLPQIQGVEITSRTDKPLHVGDSLEVLMRGDAGLRASMDLGHERVEIPMIEESPGLYRGHYRVVIGDELSEPITLHLGDRFGLVASLVVREPEVRIEARPPGRPLRLTAALHAEGKVMLHWEPGEGPEAESYRVYGIDSYGTPTLLADVEISSALLPGGRWGFGVAGIDGRGNLGPLAFHRMPEEERDSPE